MRIEGLPPLVNNEASKVRRADRPQSRKEPISSSQTAKEIEKFIEAHHKNLIFSFDRQAGRVVVTIKNGVTVQIPDEKMLKLSIALKEAARMYQRGRKASH